MIESKCWNIIKTSVWVFNMELTEGDLGSRNTCTDWLFFTRQTVISMQRYFTIKCTILTETKQKLIDSHKLRELRKKKKIL